MGSKGARRDPFQATYFMRHLKADVLTLPKLHTIVNVLEFTNEEFQTMRAYIALLIKALEEFSRNRGKKDGSANFVNVLSALLRIRQVGIHPRLPNATQQISNNKHAVGAKRKTASKDEEEDSDEEDEFQGISAESTDLEAIKHLADGWALSTKFTHIRSNIRELTNGGGLLIYSSFSTPLRAINMMLKDIGVESVLYIGETDAYERTVALRRFKSGEVSVMLLTYGSGGTGLNLCPAGRAVLHLDTPWTPASIRQATDRIHRFGTTHEINEHILVAKSTTDDFIFNQVHRAKQHHMSKLDALATSLKGLKAKTAASGMNAENLQRMADWFKNQMYIFDQKLRREAEAAAAAAAEEAALKVEE